MDDSKRFTTVRVKLHKEIPGGFVEIEAQATATYADEEWEISRLGSALDASWSNYIAAMYPSTTSVMGNNADVQLGGDWYPVARLRKSVIDGKPDVYRALAGQWSTHGISVFPEVWERSKIDPEEIVNTGDKAITPKGSQLAIYVISTSSGYKVTKVGYAT